MRRTAAIFAVLVVALAGCGGSVPTESPTPNGTTTDGSTAAPQGATDATDAPTETEAANERRTTTERATESTTPDERTGSPTSSSAETAAPSARSPTSAPAASTPTAAPTETPTAAPTEAPTPTPTPASTETPIATPTATPTPDSTPRTEWTVTVVEVVDGDTLKVRFPDGHTENVRLLGVDTPEVHVANDPAEFEGVPNTEAGHDWLRDWGHKASEFARTTVAGERIRIATDPADWRGSYGRLLVYAYHDGGQLFNRELLEHGYARLYESEFSKRDAFASAEATARRNGVGLWGYEASTPAPTPIPDGGSTDSAALTVAEVHADASGNDHENLNGEYIVLRNAGDEPLDLSGWTVSDEANHAYTFSGVTLAPGESLTLYTGAGTDDGSNVYWGSEAAVWNNGGDTIIVTTDGGETALRYEY